MISIKTIIASNIKVNPIHFVDKNKLNDCKIEMIKDKTGTFKKIYPVLKAKECRASFLHAKDIPFPLPPEVAVAAIIHDSEKSHPENGNESSNEKLIVILCPNEDQAIIAPLFAQVDARKQYGKVKLVGFGPGDPELLTIKGKKAIDQADVILYDDLTHKQFIQSLDNDALYVGKRREKHAFKQQDINNLLLKLAREGKNVVRLKGGDPMIFGRAGEEMEFLGAHFIEVESIPGITTASAAASQLLFSLTHRHLARDISFISGHSPENTNIPNTGTVVVYMGAKHAREIAKKAIESGKNPETPVALLHEVSKPEFDYRLSTLAGLGEETAALPTPLLMIISNAIRPELVPREINRGSVVLYTGSSVKKFFEQEVSIRQNYISIQPVHESGEIKMVFKKFNDYDTIILPSKNSVNVFLELLIEHDVDIRQLSGKHISCVGKRSAVELKKRGIQPDFVPDRYYGDAILELFSQFKTKKNILVPGSNIGLKRLEKGLTDMGHNVTMPVIYKNEIPDLVPVNLDRVDYIYFSSPSGFEHFMNYHSVVPDSVVLVCIGHKTTSLVREYGLKNKIILEKDLNPGS